jgi:hypothetical protein
MQPGGGGLCLLIEKDFRCLHRAPGEEQDDADAFLNRAARVSKRLFCSITNRSLTVTAL